MQDGRTSVFPCSQFAKERYHCHLLDVCGANGDGSTYAFQTKTNRNPEAGKAAFANLPMPSQLLSAFSTPPNPPREDVANSGSLAWFVGNSESPLNGRQKTTGH